MRNTTVVLSKDTNYIIYVHAQQIEYFQQLQQSEKTKEKALIKETTMIEPYRRSKIPTGLRSKIMKPRYLSPKIHFVSIQCTN